ncbi:MAG: glycosyltransferase family 4 protein [Bacteroidetes bacterium]|nr:glycosyltransferase family 4 protein [Bacteroidota bacterium]
MRIVILSTLPDQQQTGPSIVAFNVLQKLKNSNNSVHSFQYFNDGKEFSFFQKLFGNKNISGSNYVGIFTLLIKLISIKPKVIHILTFERVWLAAVFYKIFFRCKLIFTVHGCVLHEHLNYRDNIPSFLFLKDKFCEWFYINFADKLHFVSNKIYNISTHYYKIDKSKVEIIPNGIEYLHPLKKKNKNYNIIFASNISRIEKGFQFLKSALEISKTKINLFLMSDQLSKISFNNKNIKVRYFSEMERTKFLKLLSNASILVAPSITDSYSMVAQEALLLNLKVIISDNCGITEFVKDPNLYKVEYGDVLKLTDLIETLLNSESKNSSNLKLPDWDFVANRLIETYKT